MSCGRPSSVHQVPTALGCPQLPAGARKKENQEKKLRSQVISSEAKLEAATRLSRHLHSQLAPPTKGTNGTGISSHTDCGGILAKIAAKNRNYYARLCVHPAFRYTFLPTFRRRSHYGDCTMKKAVCGAPSCTLPYKLPGPRVYTQQPQNRYITPNKARKIARQNHHSSPQASTKYTK